MIMFGGFVSLIIFVCCPVRIRADSIKMNSLSTPIIYDFNTGSYKKGFEPLCDESYNHNH